MCTTREVTVLVLTSFDCLSGRCRYHFCPPSLLCDCPQIAAEIRLRDVAGLVVIDFISSMGGQGKSQATGMKGSGFKGWRMKGRVVIDFISSMGGQGEGLGISVYGLSW